LAEFHSLFVVQLEISPEEHVDGTLEQVQELVLIGMHLPFVALSSCCHGEMPCLATVELYRQVLD